MMAKIKNFGLNTRFADKLYSNIHILGSTIVHLSGILPVPPGNAKPEEYRIICFRIRLKRGEYRLLFQGGFQSSDQRRPL